MLLNLCPAALAAGAEPAEEAGGDASEGTVRQEETVKSGTCGANLTWTLADDVLTISGTGDMAMYDDKEDLAPWRSYSFSSVVITDGVTSIGRFAFCRCASITSIVIPQSVTSIGNCSFFACEGLTNIDLPQGLTTIPYMAFANCKGFTSFVIPDGVTSIDQCAFRFCSNLKEIAIPDSVVTIGNSVFEGCTSLEKVAISHDNSSCTSIGGFAFQDCTSLTEIVIPDSLTKITEYTFQGCTSLKKIVIPNGVVSINENSFYNCMNLTSIVIPDSVTAIAGNAFYNCEKLTILCTAGSYAETYAKENNVACTLIETAGSGTCGENLTWKVENGTLTISGTGEMESYSYHTPWKSCFFQYAVIEEGVTSIGRYAFAYEELTSIDIPKGVTSIGDYAFYYCLELTEVDIPEGVISIGEMAFHACDKMKTANVPDSVTSIGRYAFEYCHSLTSINIPNVTTIEAYMFDECWNLANVTISGGVTCIGFGAFFDCKELTAVHIPDSVNTIEGLAFSCCTKLTDVEIPGNVTSIGDSVFSYCTSLEHIDIPNSVTSLGHSAFDGCTSLTSIDLPDNITSIGFGTFSDCTSITEIDIPDGVTSIGQYAFSECSNLASISIPGSVTSITDNAFRGVPKSLIISCYAGSYAETYAKENGFGITYIPIEEPSRTLSLTVLAPDETPLTSGFTVTWYDSDGNQAGTGLELLGANKKSIYSFEITLDNKLSKVYAAPERQEIAPGDEAVKTVQLRELPKLTLTGRVLDPAGEPVSGAAVTVTSDSPSSTVTAATGDDGRFEVEVLCAPIEITIRAEGYYIETVSKNLTGETDPCDIGDCTLTVLIQDRVTLQITQKQAAKKGAQAVETNLTSAEALRFTLTGGDGQTITEYDVQGLELLFRPEAVSASETITISAIDPSGQYVCSEAVTVILDENRTGSAALTLVQKGGFVLGNILGPKA